MGFKHILVWLSVVELFITFSSYPLNFLKLGRYGALPFWGMSWIAITTPLIFWDELSGASLITTVAICQVVVIALVAACFIFPQGWNLRYMLWCSITGKPVDRRKYVLEAVLRESSDSQSEDS